MTFLLDIRNAAMQCSDPFLLDELKLAADNLNSALECLHSDPTEDTMRRANAAWAYAHRVLMQVKAENDDDPTGGSVEGVLLQMAA
jgi:hypothetical protein